MRAKRIANLLTLYSQIALYYTIGLTIFAISRITFLMQHTTFENIMEHKESLPLLISNGGRFDLQAISYIASPMIISAIIIAMFCNEKNNKKFASVIRYYFTILFTLLLLLVVAETFYFENFNNRYHFVFFDFFDEGPLSLLQTMWQDYPCFKILLLCVFIAFIISFIGKHISKIKISQRKWMQNKATISLPFLILAITFVFLRGSVTRYTLQVEHFVVSTDETMNLSVPNALYLLKKAYKERKNSYKLMTTEELLKENGYKTILNLIETAGFNIPDSLQKTDTESILNNILFKRIDTTQSDKRFNVLLILNESWSSYLNAMDRGDSLDILSDLRSHMKKDIVLNNFQSVRNGTIYTLETVTLAMPYMRFFHSRYRLIPFPTSITYPFKENGYNTTFVTGMDPTWENVFDGLKHQNFDTIIGRQELLHSVEGSSENLIGVFDEYLYTYLLDKMQEKSEKPQFILALTTTNHPPFIYPKNLKLAPLTDLWYKSPMLTGNKDVLTKYGQGIQYSNQQLGRFLNKFKNSPLAQNTIVVVTGDHNVRTILDYSQGHVDVKHRHQVPLYIHLPEELLPDSLTKKKIEGRYGSHLDLLPTIAPMTLKSGTRYLNIGQNLFDTERADSLYYSYNEKQLLSPNYQNNDSLMKLMQARELLMKIYYQLQFAKTIKTNN